MKMNKSYIVRLAEDSNISLFNDDGSGRESWYLTELILSKKSGIPLTKPCTPYYDMMNYAQIKYAETHKQPNGNYKANINIESVRSDLFVVVWHPCDYTEMKYFLHIPCTEIELLEGNTIAITFNKFGILGKKGCRWLMYDVGSIDELAKRIKNYEYQGITEQLHPA